MLLKSKKSNLMLIKSTKIDKTTKKKLYWKRKFLIKTNLQSRKLLNIKHENLIKIKLFRKKSLNIWNFVSI